MSRLGHKQDSVDGQRVVRTMPRGLLEDAIENLQETADKGLATDVAWDAKLGKFRLIHAGDAT